MNSEMEQLIEIFRNSNNMVFFGGAGMSTESGIPDFRSSNGLWNEKLKVNIKPEELVSHTYFKKYPEEFFEFYKDKLIYPKAEPNAGHIALAKLEYVSIFFVIIEISLYLYSSSLTSFKIFLATCSISEY